MFVGSRVFGLGVVSLSGARNIALSGGSSIAAFAPKITPQYIRKVLKYTLM